MSLLVSGPEFQVGPSLTKCCRCWDITTIKIKLRERLYFTNLELVIPQISYLLKSWESDLMKKPKWEICLSKQMIGVWTTILPMSIPDWKRTDTGRNAHYQRIEKKSQLEGKYYCSKKSPSCLETSKKCIHQECCEENQVQNIWFIYPSLLWETIEYFLQVWT